MAFDGLENLLAISEDLPDLDSFLGTVLAGWDFKDDPEQITRAETLLEFQKKIPQTRALADAKVTKIEKKATGTDNSNFINICTLDTGTRVFCKLAYNTPGDKTSIKTKKERHTRILNECSAYFLACLLGDKYEKLFMPIILAKHDDRICMLVEESTKTAAWHVNNWNQIASKEDKKNAAFFDALVNNIDRHPGNFMIDKQSGALTMIDHETILALGHTPDYGSTFYSERIKNDPSLTPQETKTLEGLLKIKPILDNLFGEKRADLIQENATHFLKTGAMRRS